MTVTLIAPVRFLSGFLCFCLGAISLQIAALSDNKYWFKFWTWVMSRWVYAMCHSLGYVTITWEGIRENYNPRDAKIIVSNHVCSIEVFTIYCMCNGCSFVSTTRNLKYPFFPAITHCSNAILVDKKDPDSRKKVAAEIVNRYKRAST